MKKVVINKLMSIIEKYNKVENTKLNEIQYGIEMLYLAVTKLIVIIIINILINQFKSFILLYLFFSFLRLFGFGLHTKTSFQCWIVSIIIYTLIPFCINNFIIPYKINIIIALICLILLFIYAPSDTEKRPLINGKKRFVLKILTTCTALIYLVIIFINKNIYISNILSYSLAIETLTVLPISYKLFGLKYKNYIGYNKRKGGTK